MEIQLETAEYTAEEEKTHTRGWVRILLIAAGSLFVGLGVLFLKRPRGERMVMEALALLAAAVGVVWETIDALRSIWESTSSTAAIGYVVLGLAAGLVGVIFYALAWSGMALVVGVYRLVRDRSLSRVDRAKLAAGCVILMGAAGLWLWSQDRSAVLAEAESSSIEAWRVQRLKERALRRGDDKVLCRLAANPAVNVETLRAMYDAMEGWDGKDYTIMHNLARNPKTPTDILADLALREEVSIRVAVALNRGISADTIERLSWDEDALVRTWLCNNPSVGEEVLKRLTQDPDKIVRDYAQSALEYRNREQESSGQRDERSGP